MNKKEYIAQVLDKLGSYRPIARGLKVLLKEDKLADEQINGLLSVFEHAIKEATDTKQKEKLQQSMAAIQKMQSLEKQQQQKDHEDIKDLENMIDRI